MSEIEKPVEERKLKFRATPAEEKVEDRSGLFTADEEEAMRAEARKLALEEVKKEKKAEFRKNLIAEERAKAQRELGMIIGDKDKDEFVSVTINIPSYSDRLIVNGVIYMQGYSYQVARHVADSLNDMMERGRQHEHAISGKSAVDFYRQKSPLEVTPAGVNKASQDLVRIV